MTDKLPQPDRVIFAWLRFHDSARAHAIVDTHTEATDEYVILSLDDDQEPAAAPWLREGRTLCGVVATGGTQFQVTPERTFSPSGVPGYDWMATCGDCARRWSAEYAPRIDGWTKNCASCRQERPVTAFRGDGRTRDKLSARCESCRDAEKQVRVELRSIEQDIVRTEIRRVRAVAEAEVTAMSLQKWQDASWLPVFTCQAGHRLGAEVLGEDVAWLCHCGTAPVDQRVMDLCAQISHHGDPLWNADLGKVQMATPQEQE